MSGREISINQGEEKKPSLILQDKCFEELAFSHIFSNDHFEYRVEWEAKLTPVNILISNFLIKHSYLHQIQIIYVLLCL